MLNTVVRHCTRSGSSGRTRERPGAALPQSRLPVGSQPWRERALQARRPRGLVMRNPLVMTTRSGRRRRAEVVRCPRGRSARGRVPAARSRPDERPAKEVELGHGEIFEVRCLELLPQLLSSADLLGTVAAPLCAILASELMGCCPVLEQAGLSARPSRLIRLSGRTRARSHLCSS
jgi:hypothetical protein